MPILEITTMVGCPMMCAFCPQDELRNAYPASAPRQLSLSDFTLILQKIPPHVSIQFSGMAEPWANPKTTDMLALTLERGFSVAIFTTLHGMTLTDADRVVRLLTAHATQLEHLCLHLPDANLHMRGWRFSTEYAAVLSRILELQSQGPCFDATRMSVMTMDGSGALHPDLNVYRGAVTEKTWRGHSRAGNLSAELVASLGGRPAPRHDSAVSCGKTPFYDQNVLLPNGDVFLCCMDYSLSHKIGNLIEQDYDALFLSHELASLRAENAKPRFSGSSLCKSCSWATTYELRASRWTVPAEPMSFRQTVSHLAPSLRRALRRRLARR